jgi:selenocysteine-specific elongation factor
MTEKEHVIIGTAGHIDHGKTALVKALTGKDADTLEEEKRRGITIELGFIFMSTPGLDKQIVFIDVPGHEKLVKTMVAGASNIDAALFVIAADEGINMQTIEHFDILQLLDIQTGIIALTKSDLVDEIQIEKLKAAIKSFTEGSFLEGALIIPVSSLTGDGVEDIRSALVNISQGVKKRYDNGIFRMPVDRVFTMRGFGTVIAGTILSGEVKTGDKLEVFPDGIKAKVRGIQVHNKKVDRSSIGKRTALNLQDVKKEMLRRGQCIGTPDTLVPSNRLDARLRLLKSYGKELKNRTRVRLHVGTDEIISRISILDKGKLAPGETGLVQFILEASSVALSRDPFVIRTFSPIVTIGGGRILDAEPYRHKRFAASTIEGLKKLTGDLPDVVEQVFLKSKFKTHNVFDIAVKIGRKKAEVEETVQDLLKKGILVRIGDSNYIHSQPYDKLCEETTSKIKAFLVKNSFRMYMPFSDIRSQLLKVTDLPTFQKIMDNLIEKRIVFKKDTQIGLPGHEIRLDDREQKTVQSIEDTYKKARFNTPLEEDVCKNLRIPSKSFQNMMKSLIEQGKLIRLNPKVTYHRDSLDALKKIVIDHIQRHKSISIAELRDKLRLSRKYTQAILEYFNKAGVTKRIEDKHVLK